jgi:hypothetical protein
MEKVKEEDFLFGEEELIKIFGKKYLDKLKKENYEEYVSLRNSPNFMPSDIDFDKNPPKPLCEQVSAYKDLSVSELKNEITK